MKTESSRSIRPIKVTNSLTGKKENLETRIPGKLSMYSCGPTVYGLIHIGNLRAALVSDLFFRYFKRVGYDVTYVRNYTDVDDKIIDRGKKEGVSAEEIAKKYTQEVERDYAVAAVTEPTHKTSVTTHMQEIIQMIEKIIANGHAYVAPEGDDGEVLYAIDTFKNYGQLAHRTMEDLIAGQSRVDRSAKKKNPLDFALWKPAKPGEPFWASPWGNGRPGWHIECSAMATRWLGPQMDVHHGGEDLQFPHHENEIAQSEGASGKAPYVKYWMHNGFLNINHEKMSKSLGNFLTAREFLSQFGGEFARYMLLASHYRAIIDFNDETVEQTITALQRIYEAKSRAIDLQRQARARADLRAENAWGSFVASCETARKEIDEAFANDFNTAGALGALFTLIRDFNRTLAEPLAAATPSAVLGAQEFVRVLEEDIGSVLGVGRADPSKALEDLGRIRASRTAAASGGTQVPESEILAAIQARADARGAKDFAKADQIRKDLEARGVLIKDSPKGTTWVYK